MRQLSSRLSNHSTIYLEGNDQNCIESRYYSATHSLHSISSLSYMIENLGKDSTPGTTTNNLITMDTLIMDSNTYNDIFIPCRLDSNSGWVDSYGNKAFDQECFEDLLSVNSEEDRVLFKGRFNTLSLLNEKSNLYPLNYPINFSFSNANEGIFYIIIYSDDYSDSKFWCTYSTSFDISATTFPTMTPSATPTFMPTRTTQMPTPAPTRPPSYSETASNTLPEGNTKLGLLQIFTLVVIIISFLFCLYSYIKCLFRAISISNYFIIRILRLLLRRICPRWG